MKNKGTKRRTYLSSISYTDVKTGAVRSTVTQLYKIGLYMAFLTNGKHSGQSSRQNPPTTSETTKTIKSLEKAVENKDIKDLYYTTTEAWEVNGFWEEYIESWEVSEDYTYELNTHFYKEVKLIKSKYVFDKFGYQFYVSNTGPRSFSVSEWSTGACICARLQTEEDAIKQAKKKLTEKGQKLTERGVNHFLSHKLTKINKPYKK